MVSVIIPSLDGYRGGNVPKLIQALDSQTFQDFEIIIATGEKPNSRARNVGVQSAQGKIIVFFDDDVILGDTKVIENLIAPFASYPDIGITGASTLIPPDANRFQKLCAREFKRFEFPVAYEIIETDMAHHAALSIRKDVYLKVGQENENLLLGTDPDLRYRVRQAGYQVVIVPHTWVYHPPHLDLTGLLKGIFRKGQAAAHVFWHYPNLVYETPSGHEKNFKPQRTFLYRALRFIIDNIDAFIQLKLIFLFTRISYGLGYFTGLIKLMITRQ